MELLIVVVVIAILAAISIVAYRGVASNAQAAAIKANLSQAANKLEMYRVDNGGYPPDQATLAGLLKPDSSTTLTYAANNSANPPTYCLTATQGGAQQFSVNSASRIPSDTACLTNLAVDPRATGFNVAGGPRVQNSRYTADGTYSLVTGAMDGPTVAAGVTSSTYARYSVAIANKGHGFELSGNPQATQPATLPWTVTAGMTYTVSAWVRYTGTVSTMQAHIVMRAATSQSSWTATQVVGTTLATPAGQWVRLSATYAAPAGAMLMAAHVEGRTDLADAPGDSWDITGLMVTQGAILYNYADGNSPGWSWTGTPNASTSIGPPL